MNLELVMGIALVVTAAVLILAMLLPVRAARPAPVDYEARRRRFDGAVPTLLDQGFKTERMLISHDGSVALFLGETCGRACILRPQPERKMAVDFRDMRTLGLAEAIDLVTIAPDTGLIGRLRGDPRPGTRQMVGADLRVRFDATLEQAETLVQIHFAPEDSSQARIATSVLRGKAERLRLEDAQAEAQAKARAEAEANSPAAEARRARARKEAERREAEERRQMHLRNLLAERR